MIQKRLTKKDSIREALVKIQLNFNNLFRLTPLEDKAPTSGTYQVDWTKETFFCTLTQNTTFSEINLPSVGTKVITIYVSGDFTLTLPTTWTTGNYFEILGSYDPLQKNQIVVEYIKPNHYWIGITQNA